MTLKSNKSCKKNFWLISLSYVFYRTNLEVDPYQKGEKNDQKHSYKVKKRGGPMATIKLQEKKLKVERKRVSEIEKLHE